MTKEYKYLAGGDWKKSDEVLEVRNPFDDSISFTTYKATGDDVERATKAAVDAFEQTKRLSSYEKSEVLSNIWKGIEKRKREIAETITLEAGKPLQYSLIEVERSVFLFQIASEEAKRIKGETIPLDIIKATGDTFAINKHFPIGPIFGITPFNFPLNLVSHKVAPALAAGNSIIIKPASATPITAIILGEIIMESGLPEGAFSVLPMSSDLGEEMVKDDRFKMASFTGSPKVGWHLKSISSKKKIALELGGNAGCIIDKDTDLPYAAGRCCYGGYAFSGQTCISLQRLYVHENVYDEFLPKFINCVEGLKVGDPIDESTEFGPMIKLKEAERAENWINEAVNSGAKILTGGKRKGTILEPTVLGDTSADMKVNCSEVFGPIVTVTKCSSFADGVERVNDSVYGLQAGIFTKDIGNIFLAYKELDVGGVVVNDAPTFRLDNMPYGGVNESGLGREGIVYAMEEMSEIKLLVFRNC
ncbi:MAG: aldehyde dehydrogenase family protein [Candidatus Anammoxibacter sp.]